MPKLGKLFAIGAVALGVAFSAFGVNAEEPPPSLDPGATAPEEALLKLLDDDELLRARREADAYLVEHPQSIVAHYVLGRVLHAAEGALPQAMRELGRARELYEARHPPGSEASNFRLHQQILYSTAWLALELEEFEFQLEILDFHDALYNPMAAGEHAWPLMRLKRFDKAREYANHAIASKSPYQRALGHNALCALEGEAEEREAYFKACEAALKNKRAQPVKALQPSTLAIDAYNAALAARAAFRPDDAEKLALEGSRTFAPSSANPWRLIAQLRLDQGRASEAIEALRDMQAWRRRQPANVRAQDRAETDAVSATVFLLAGELERGLALADGLLDAPDRRGLSTSTAEEALGGHALLRRALRRAQGELDAERRSWGEPRFDGLWSRARARVERYWSDRADEERIVRVMTDSGRLTATLRPYIARGLDDVPPWLVGDLVSVLGPGVVGAQLDAAREREPEKAAIPYFDAYEAEVNLESGDDARAVVFAQNALDALPPSEALLRARTAAVGFRASEEKSPGALAFLEQALALDGSVFRRMGFVVPVRLELPDDAMGAALTSLLEASPRLEVGAVGVVIRIQDRGLERVICIHGPTSGAVLQCGKPRERAPGSDLAPDSTPAGLAARFAAALHLDAFALPLGLSGNDVSSLDGSTTTSGQAVHDKLQGVLDDGLLPVP